MDNKKERSLSEAEIIREQKLCAFVEQLLQAKVVHIQRQLRWRPAWFLELETPEGEIVKVHARGDRESDVVPFPGLKREADILEVLESEGIPVPHVYGMCSDPAAIIMETVPGTRDVSEAEDDDQRHSIARQYIDGLAAMHRAPVASFVARGIELPEGPEEIALAGVKAYMPLYEKHKARPDPLIEFALGWLRRNVPMHRKRASFMAFDAGQFLFHKGKLTAMYDFEFAMIGDPLTDLATMAMRQSVEPMGDSIANLCRYYGEVTGEPVDVRAMRYHHTVFATVACMQFVGAITNPQPGDPHDVYVDWDLALRRSLINVLAENIGVEVPSPEPVVLEAGKHQALLTMLNDSINGITPAADVDVQQKNASSRLLEYYQRLDRAEGPLQRLAIADAGKLFDPDPDIDLDSQLETFVLKSGSEKDVELIQYLAAQIERRVQVYSDVSVGRSAAHVSLEPIPQI